MLILKPSTKAVAKVVELLKRGEVLVCPTDTVYGFLADASNKRAVEEIYKIKNRPRSKPLPIFVKDLQMAKQIAEINEKQEKILKKYWPGKYTFILKLKRTTNLTAVRFVVRGTNGKTIAVRIPKYKFLNNLLKKINKPLVQTSVNISGQPTLTKIKDIKNKFTKSNIFIIDGGNLKKSKPSTIIDLTSKLLTRLR